jgi:hypothetical protein
LCEFYAAAIRRLLYLFNLEVDVGIEECRATGAAGCRMIVTARAVAPELAA